ncbi:hypothetical protein [Avibacterium paragallinarum]|uniref:hypothetical protein n=1 Tax=Avibacterium paragallinarum TaxID=728 RepID=UPI00021ACD78|nr:hypothetical protein [Avibacterium paragallinarum]AZI15172.1 hypothetical protein EIA51_11520 [Avibacterium paragallinarum]QIR12605.1 hypothetical protein HBL79_10505 [Avibacterium paragallinarum]QLD65726.1 hypothetical protein VY92_010610 [Avibacterium paragallinarum]
MKIYKLSINTQKEYHIGNNSEQFERLTQRKAPYYQHNPKGILTAYAICPGCNNPIELIGMIRQPKDKRRYGKHCGYNVMGLALNNVEDYHCCKYRARQHYVRTQRRNVASPLAIQILNQLKTQFDRIIYLLKVTTGIQITPNLAEKMLITYLSSKGQYYTGADLRNTPWIFAYLSNSQSLYQQRISKKYEKATELICALRQSKDIEIIENESSYIITNKPNKFTTIAFCFHSHKVIAKENGEIIEKMTYSISEEKDKFDFDDPKNPLNNVLWTTEIQFDYDFYQKLIFSKKNEDKRQHNYLAIANKLIT